MLEQRAGGSSAGVASKHGPRRAGQPVSLNAAVSGTTGSKAGAAASGGLHVWCANADVQSPTPARGVPRRSHHAALGSLVSRAGRYGGAHRFWLVAGSGGQ